MKKLKPLNFEAEKIPCYIRPDQSKTLEKIKYKGRIEKDMKIPKTEIIRAALDSFFEMDVDEILKLLSDRLYGL